MLYNIFSQQNESQYPLTNSTDIDEEMSQGSLHWPVHYSIFGEQNKLTYFTNKLYYVYTPFYTWCNYFTTFSIFVAFFSCVPHK